MGENNLKHSVSSDFCNWLKGTQSLSANVEYMYIYQCYNV